MLELFLTFYIQLVAGNYEVSYKQSNSQEIQRTHKAEIPMDSRRQDNQGNSTIVPINEVEAYVLQEMGDFGILLCMCESGCNPNAVSSSGKYKGIFQFNDNTWNSNCIGDIFDYKAQTECTKRLISEGKIGKWPHCGRYF